jgi:hypothetical protein
VPKRDVEPSCEDKVVVQEVQIKDILDDSEVITIPEDTGVDMQNLSG